MHHLVAAEAGNRTLPRENGSARQFAQTLSEKDLLPQTFECRGPWFFYPLDHPMVFVKFGGPEKMAEGDMQRLAFDE